MTTIPNALRNAALAVLVLATAAACSTAAPQQTAALPNAPQHTDWLHEQVPLLPSNIDAGN